MASADERPRQGRERARRAISSATGAALGLALALAPGVAASEDPAESALAARDRERLAGLVATPPRPGGDAWAVAFALATSEEVGPIVLDPFLADDPGSREALGVLAERVLRIGLVDPDPAIRASIVEAVEQVGLERGLSLLVWAMETDPSADVRDDAVDVLRRIGGRAGRVALREALGHPDERTQRLAADALARLKDNTARRYLRREARGRDPATALWAAGMLWGRLEDRSALPVLQALLASDDAETRAASLVRLGEHPTEDAAALARGALDDEVPRVRFQAAAMLARAGDPAGAKVLREAVATGGRLEKIEAMQRLGEVGDRDAIPLLHGYLSDSSEILRENAALALVALGDADGKKYLDDQESTFGSLGAVAGALLAGRRASEEEPEAPDEKLAKPEINNRYTRASALRELGKLGASGIGAIREGLADTHPVPRRAALFALSEAGTVLDLPAAARLLADPVRSVRFAAAAAILDVLDR